MRRRASPVTYTVRRGLRPDVSIRWAVGALDAISGALRAAAAERRRITPREARLLASRIERARDLLERAAGRA